MSIVILFLIYVSMQMQLRKLVELKMSGALLMELCGCFVVQKTIKESGMQVVNTIRMVFAFFQL